jgi:hypothetical protein
MKVNSGRLTRGASGAGSTLAGRAVKLAMVTTLLAVGLSGMPFLLRELVPVSLLDESGYGDSYILHDVIQFQKTGIIYRDLSQPPYLPAQYSPLLYMLLSVPGRLTSLENPFVGPRLMIIGAFVACIGMTISLIRTLIPVRLAWIWGVLMASSISIMWQWVPQLRADFPGIFFNLLAIRLLLWQSRWAIPLAGVCVGLALQFKITFLAAGLAGALWLLVRRRWKDLATFAIVSGVFAGGPYLLYSFREPRMMSQLLALSPGIVDIKGNVRLFSQAASEPLVLFALLGLPPIFTRRWPRWSLLVVFAATSLSLAALFDLQAGGNINYYFEALLAATPIAVFGVLRLVAFARRNAALGSVIVALFCIHMLAPRVLSLYENRDYDWSQQSRNALSREMDSVLRGRHILTTVPRLSLIDPAPALTEPYLFSYLLHIGKFNPQPILKSIHNREFEAVITAARPQSWRGIPHIAPELHDAIAGSYQPRCTLGRWLLHLPVSSDGSGIALAADLGRLGCVPLPAGNSPEW